MPLEPLTPADPATVGPHRLLGRIGRGGMGTVYLALTPDDRAVAVKVLRDGPADLQGRRRFRREIEVLQRVRGPHLVEVLGGDADAPTPWLVTRYVPGTRLDEVVLRDGPLDLVALVRVGLGVARGLQALHAANVVHRDLTPGNVLLVDGEPHVIDLGLAAVADVTVLTRSGTVFGTAGYLAPEQVLGEGGGAPADVHAWGAVLALAGTGRPPYGTGRAEAVLYRVVHGRPDLEGLPEELAPLVARATAADPAERPAVGELVAELERLQARLRDLVGVGSGPHPVVPRPLLGDELAAVLGTEVTRALGREATQALRAAPPEALPAAPREAPTQALPTATTALPAPTAALPTATTALPTAATALPAARPAPPSDPAAVTQVLPVAPEGSGDAGGHPPDDDRPVVREPGRSPLVQALVAVPAALVLAAAALVAPVLVAAATGTGLLLLQAATRSALARERRLLRRGPRWRDPLVSALASPWHVLGAAVDLLVGLPLLLLGAVVPAYVVLAGGGSGATAGATATVLAGALTLARRRLRGVRASLAGAVALLAPRPRDAALTGAVLAVTAALLVGAASAGPLWWPAPAPPPSCLPVLPCP